MSLTKIIGSENKKESDEIFFNKDEEQKTGGFLGTRIRKDSNLDLRIDKVLRKLNLMQGAALIYNFDVHFGSDLIKISYQDTPLSSNVYTSDEFLELDPYHVARGIELNNEWFSDKEIRTALECMKDLRTYNDIRFLIFYRINAIEKKVTTTTSTGKTRLFRDIATLEDYTDQKVKTKKVSSLKTFLSSGEEEYCTHASCLKKIKTYSDEHIDYIIEKSHELLISNTVFSMDFHCGSGMIKIWFYNNPYNPKILTVDQYLKLNKGNRRLARTNKRLIASPNRRITKIDMTKILDRAKRMRLSDEHLYLRYLSVNIPGDKISALFTCGGTYCINTNKFLGTTFDI